MGAHYVKATPEYAGTYSADVVREGRVCEEAHEGLEGHAG